jgi:hypothetical protein
MAIMALLFADNQAIITEDDNSTERAKYMLSRIAGNLKLKVPTQNKNLTFSEEKPSNRKDPKRMQSNGIHSFKYLGCNIGFLHINDSDEKQIFNVSVVPSKEYYWEKPE